MANYGGIAIAFWLPTREAMETADPVSPHQILDKEGQDHPFSRKYAVAADLVPEYRIQASRMLDMGWSQR